jgi:hypothetical protein
MQGLQPPPIGRLAQTLRVTTERLAADLGAPRTRAPQWSDVEWRIARAAAAIQGLAPLLDSALAWRGPDGWCRFLREQSAQSAARHALIRAMLDDLDARARAAGVAMLPLKGAALYAMGLYSPGARPMGDIDLLVGEDDVEAAAAVLLGAGYEWAFDIQRHRVFRPRGSRESQLLRLGEHIDNPIKIELHSRIAERLPTVEVDLTRELLEGATGPGLRAYPSRLALMRHLLLHAAGNMRARALRHVQIHDIALLASTLAPPDWDRLQRGEGPDGAVWWAAPPLALVERYYPGVVPRGALDALLAACPLLLAAAVRRHDVTHVSWSNIRIQAFPGLEWSRTPGEAFRFMRTRIFPSRAARSELREGAAQIPQSATVPWYARPHAERILRWMFARPPRVQTMLSVRAALSLED